MGALQRNLMNWQAFNARNEALFETGMSFKTGQNEHKASHDSLNLEHNSRSHFVDFAGFVADFSM